jgi:tRNA G26 N,N-dimethylase Trm1
MLLEQIRTGSHSSIPLNLVLQLYIFSAYMHIRVHTTCMRTAPACALSERNCRFQYHISSGKGRVHAHATLWVPIAMFQRRAAAHQIPMFEHGAKPQGFLE